MADSKKDKKNHWIYKLRDKYRLVIVDEDIFEELFSFRLSRLNVFVTIGTIAILLIVATTFLIAFTPLREYIPGYQDVTLTKRLKEMERLTDSLQADFRQKNLYLQNIKNIIEGKVITEVLRDSAHDFRSIFSALLISSKLIILMALTLLSSSFGRSLHERVP